MNDLEVREEKHLSVEEFYEANGIPEKEREEFEFIAGALAISAQRTMKEAFKIGGYAWHAHKRFEEIKNGWTFEKTVEWLGSMGMDFCRSSIGRLVNFYSTYVCDREVLATSLRDSYALVNQQADEVVGLPSRMKIMFPSHIGSRSTHPSGLLFFRASSFPSHIGSRSTQQADEVVGLPSVSIPHWFSLNKTLLHSTKCTFKRFHPTLVLAQRRKYVPAIVLDSFPSHIGSRSTRFTLCTSVPTRSFPSHIGSRSTILLTLTPSSYSSFHPTLVLAQLILNKNSHHFQPVSIPHWFSLNTFHTLHVSSNTLVSIPHWFSLNHVLGTVNYLSPGVSIPHWFSLNEASAGNNIHGARFVSIPHWFSLNMVSVGEFRELQSWFPSHIGSRSTFSVIADGIRLAVFPSHIGSRSTSPHLASEAFYKFPSHIGSRSTIIYCLSLGIFFQCFHPTLVLAQHNTASP